MLSYADRNKNLNRFAKEEFDLVIIGGGISGAGVARDAASRGMKVALVEAGDFAVGTSSRSSKLIHGGIRYLENMEFGLVFEALRERRNLFEIAPHLVHPLRFVLPLYRGGRVGMFKLGLGMWAYDVLSLFEAPKLHERLNASQCLDRMPILEEKDLLGGYVYSDAYMDDDRLVIETLRSAARWGATVANYCRAVGAEMRDGKMMGLVCRDELTSSEIKIRGRHFVSTVGPWTDIVAHRLIGEWKDIMRPSKGVHLTFERSRLALNDAVVMISDDERRIVFAIPRHEMVIIGTTDTDFSGDPSAVKTTNEDVDYLLGIVDNYFPGAKIKRDDIIASYSGVRPLVDDGAATESQTSREHVIISDPRNITFLTGGKYTTYRNMAEQTVNVVLQSFAMEDQVRFAHSRTKEALNPKADVDNWRRAQASAEAFSVETGLDVDTVHFLAERHGGEAFDIMRAYHKKVSPGPWSRWEYEAYHALNETMCISLLDYYLRRVPLFLSRRDHGLPLVQRIAKIFQDAMAWTDAKTQEEIRKIQEHLKTETGWR